MGDCQDRKLQTLGEMVEVVFQTEHNKSLLKKHLTRDIVHRLQDKRTSLGGTLADCIRTGTWEPDSNMGIHAADAEAYTVFSDILDPIIKDCHRLKGSDPITHPPVDFGDLDNLDLPDLDPENEMILSTRIRLGRSHQEFGFPPVLKKEDWEAMERKSVEALQGLDGELKGTYYPLSGMSQGVQDQLINDHYLFVGNNRFRKASGAYAFWPAGRGIFFNEAKSFLVWVNEEDHLRVISMQSGGDVGAVYRRLVKGVKALEQKLTFARDDRLGYLSFCPSNLGTGMRASVLIRTPEVSALPDFKDICHNLKLQVRGFHGEDTEGEGGVYDISNKRRLGVTEIQVVREMCEGVKEILKMEKDLQAKKKTCPSSGFISSEK